MSVINLNDYRPQPIEAYADKETGEIVGVGAESLDTYFQLSVCGQYMCIMSHDQGFIESIKVDHFNELLFAIAITFFEKDLH